MEGLVKAVRDEAADVEQAAKIVREDLDYICAQLRVELDRMAGKRLLVTGGGGFLGYYIVQAVLRWNEEESVNRRIHVTVLENYSRGVPAWLEELDGNPQLDLLEHDVRHPLPSELEDVQYIIHAASIASPTYYRRYPIETMDANVNGLRHLLEYCRSRKESESPVEGFLFFSTSEIYGDPDSAHIPTPETYRGNVSCTGPRACYDESKRYGETLCVNFAVEYGLPIRVARPFNNYGPGLKITDRRVLPDFARNVLDGEDIVLLSDGSATRTYCYVADAVAGYFKVLVTGRDGEAYNIGVDGPEVSVVDFAERVIGVAGELFGYSGQLVREVDPDPDYLTDNPNRRCPVIEKARREIGYEPTISLDEGLRRSLLWYSGNRSAEDE